MTEKQVLEETIAKWNDSVNDISKFKFNSKEVDLFCGMLKRFGEMKVSQALNLTDVMRSNFSKTWNIWCSVWGIIGVIYWLNKLINYYA